MTLWSVLWIVYLKPTLSPLETHNSTGLTFSASLLLDNTSVSYLYIYLAVAALHAYEEMFSNISMGSHSIVGYYAAADLAVAR